MSLESCLLAGLGCKRGRARTENPVASQPGMASTWALAVGTLSRQEPEIQALLWEFVFLENGGQEKQGEGFICEAKGRYVNFGLSRGLRRIKIKRVNH